VTVGPDVAQLRAPPCELPARERTATTVVLMNVRFTCAPEEMSRRLRHWQLGRAQLICPGSALPSEEAVSDPSIRGIVVIPAADLGLPPDVIQRAIRMLPGSPVHGLLREHVAGLFRDADAITRLGGAAMVGRATIELVRALLSSAGHDPDANGDAWDQTLEARLAAYIEEHLQDPGLGAGELARVHGISVRQLYKLWSSRETSLSQWITRRRLHAARADLGATVGNSHAKIAAVALQWGFVNVSHFSRRFRDVYGMSPREWQQAREGQEL
jgi:AraC-like DNA-binding protein